MRWTIRFLAVMAVAATGAGAQVTAVPGPIALTNEARIRFQGFNRSGEQSSHTRRVIAPPPGCDVGGGFTEAACGPGVRGVIGSTIHLGASATSNFVIRLDDLAITQTRQGFSPPPSLAGGTVTPFNAFRLGVFSDLAGTFELSLGICALGGGNCTPLDTYSLTAGAPGIDRFFVGAGSLAAYELQGTVTWTALDDQNSNRPSIEFQFGNAAVVPEPSTYALLATGLAGLGVVARRRRRA